MKSERDEATRDAGLEKGISLLEADKGKLWIGSVNAGLTELDPQLIRPESPPRISSVRTHGAHVNATNDEIDKRLLKEMDESQGRLNFAH